MTEVEIGNRDKHFPRRVALLLSSDAIGGEERYFMELAVGLQRSAVHPIIINLKAGLPYKAELERHSIPAYTNVAPNRFDFFGVLRLFRIIRDFSPDVLIINGNRQSLWLGSILGRWGQVPVILIHTHASMGMYSFTLRISSFFSDAVVAAANNHRSHLRSVYSLKPEKVFSVYPGIDQSRTGTATRDNFRGFSEKKPWVVGIIAALRPEKDHETFLRAATFLTARVPDARFLVIGDGPRRALLENLAREMGLSSNVDFLGWQRVDRNLLGEIDVLTLSSFKEAFPAVIIEAFSAGIPFVATDVGSVSELFGSPPCGLLVPPRNPRALADALLMLMEDQQLYTTISQRALERAKLFSGDRFSKDILQLARSLLKKKLKTSSPT